MPDKHSFNSGVYVLFENQLILVGLLWVAWPQVVGLTMAGSSSATSIFILELMLVGNSYPGKAHL